MKSVRVVDVRVYSVYVDATVVLARYERYWLQAPREWHDSVETCRSV